MAGGWPTGTSGVDPQDLIRRGREINAAPVQGDKANADASFKLLDDICRYFAGMTETLSPEDQARVARRLNEEMQKPPKYVPKVQPKKRGVAVVSTPGGQL